MNVFIRSLRLGSIAALACCSTQAGADTLTAEYTSAAEIKALLTTTVNGVVAHQVKTGPGTPVIVARRDGPGQVELHLKQNDVVVAQKGSVTVLLGTKIEGNREVAPNEWLGGTIIGGKTYTLNAGDVLWIPAGVGHLMTVPPGGSFSYLVVKTDVKP
jgi:hypothetical protein